MITERKKATISAGIGSSLPADELSRALKIGTTVPVSKRNADLGTESKEEEKFISDVMVTDWRVKVSTGEDGIYLTSGPPRADRVFYCFDITAAVELTTNLTDAEIGRSLEINFRFDADMREIAEIFDYQQVSVSGDLYTCTGDVISSGANGE